MGDAVRLRLPGVRDEDEPAGERTGRSGGSISEVGHEWIVMIPFNSAVSSL